MIAVLAAVWLLGAAAPPAAEIHRAFAAVSLAASEEPALRAERQTREPSPGFLLGAALGAWINAAAQLDFDLRNPAAIGPAHAHLAAGEGAVIMQQDCGDETTAFDHLTARAKGLGMSPAETAAAAGAPAETAAAWTARATGPAAACR